MSNSSSEQIDARRGGANRRDDIIVCAAKVFNRTGIRGATIADVAAELGVNLTTVRHYFPKREDLIEAVMSRVFELTATLHADAMLEATPEARVRRFAAQVFDFHRRVASGAEPDIIHFSELRSLTPPYSDRVWARYADMFRGYRAICSTPREIAEDRIRANVRAHILLGQMTRLVLWLPTYSTAEYDRVCERFVDVLLNGLLASGAWSPRPVDLPPEEPQESLSASTFLAAATAIINQNGCRGASVQRIAASLNVTKGSFYHHISAKSDLVEACCERTVEVLADVQSRALAAERKGIDQAVAAVTALALLQRRPGALIKTSSLASMEPEPRARFSAKMDAISLRFADMVSDGMIDGSGRICDARIAGNVIMAFVNAAEESRRFVPGLTPEQSVDLYARSVFSGLLF